MNKNPSPSEGNTEEWDRTGRNGEKREIFGNQPFLFSRPVLSRDFPSPGTPGNSSAWTHPLLYHFCPFNRFIYLSLEDQRKLPFAIIALTPEKHFTRKNVGYLYAMAQGAKVIFDVDDDNQPVPVKITSNATTFLPLMDSYEIYERPLLYKENEITTVST